MSTGRVYAYYVRLYMLMNYSKDDSEFYALLEEKTEPRKPDAPWERPEIRFGPRKRARARSRGRKRDRARSQSQKSQKGAPEIPEKEPEPGAPEIPEKEDALSQKKESQPMLQSMVQNESDEEDNTWGNWTAQGKLQQAPSQTPTTCLRQAESNSQERSDRIARRTQILLKNTKCFSQARAKAEAMIVSKKWLTKIELNEIKAKCKKECCNPAVSPAPISEAATEHSEIRRLLNLADENSKSSEVASQLSTHKCKLEQDEVDEPPIKDVSSFFRPPGMPRMIPVYASKPPQEVIHEDGKSHEDGNLEAATEHSKIPEAATDHSKSNEGALAGSSQPTSTTNRPGNYMPPALHTSVKPKAKRRPPPPPPSTTCLEAKRPRKAGKGSFSQTHKNLYPGTNAKTTTQAWEH